MARNIFLLTALPVSGFVVAVLPFQLLNASLTILALNSLRQSN